MSLICNEWTSGLGGTIGGMMVVAGTLMKKDSPVNITGQIIWGLGWALYWLTCMVRSGNIIGLRNIIITLATAMIIASSFLNQRTYGGQSMVSRLLMIGGWVLLAYGVSLNGSGLVPSSRRISVAAVAVGSILSASLWFLSSSQMEKYGVMALTFGWMWLTVSNSMNEIPVVAVDKI